MDIPQRSSSRTLVMKELLCIGKLAGAGKIIQHGKLTSDIGFNIEKIKKAEKEEKGVIDLGTLRNHLKKIPQEESDKAFYHHVKLFKKENNRVHKEIEGRVVPLTLLPNLRDYLAHQKEDVVFFLPFAPKCPISDKSPPSSCHFLVKAPLIFFEIPLGLS